VDRTMMLTRTTPLYVARLAILWTALWCWRVQRHCTLLDVNIVHMQALSTKVVHYPRFWQYVLSSLMFLY